MTLREAARAVFDAALRAADVHPLVRRALRRPSPRRRAAASLVVGAGKASGAMAAAAEDALGDRVADGLVVVKDGYLARHRAASGSSRRAIPVPDERGAAAARHPRRSPSRREPTTCVLVLVSGGGSALTPAPVPPITLAEKQALTRLLLAAGATINSSTRCASTARCSRAASSPAPPRPPACSRCCSPT